MGHFKKLSNLFITELQNQNLRELIDIADRFSRFSIVDSLDGTNSCIFLHINKSIFLNHYKEFQFLII